MTTPERIPAKVEGLARRAPELDLPRKALDQIVSWSELDTPITLGQYVTNKYPEKALQLGIEAERVEGNIKDADELNDEEIQKVTLARYENTDDDSVLMKGGKQYTYDDRIKGIRERNELGVDLMRVSRQSISFIETLFKLGRVKSINDKPMPYPPELPKFEF